MKTLDKVKKGSRLWVYDRGAVQRLKISEISRSDGLIVFENGLRMENLDIRKGVSTVVGGGRTMLGKVIASTTNTGLCDILWLWCKQDLLTMMGDPKEGDRKIGKMSEKICKLLVREMRKIDFAGVSGDDEDDDLEDAES